MSYGITFQANIFISHETYQTIYEVDSDIKELEEQLQRMKERLMMYCACGVKGVCSKDCEDNPMNPIDALHRELEDLFEYCDEVNRKLHNLYLLREDWDEKENKFKTVEVG